MIMSVIDLMLVGMTLKTLFLEGLDKNSTMDHDFHFMYDMKCDELYLMMDLLDEETLYKLTRAFPLLLRHPPIEWRISEYAKKNPYLCGKCGMRAATAPLFRVHMHLQHPVSFEEEYQRFFSLNNSKRKEKEK